MQPSRKSLIIVFVQLLCIGLIALLGNVIPGNIFFLIGAISGIALGVWALMVQNFNVSLTPEPEAGKTLATAGPYQYIRHPLYLAIIITTFFWWIAAPNPNFFTFILWVILVIDLIVKINYEESLLKLAYPDYAAYMQKTKRLIPKLW